MRWRGDSEYVNIFISIVCFLYSSPSYLLFLAEKMAETQVGKAELL